MISRARQAESKTPQWSTLARPLAAWLGIKALLTACTVGAVRPALEPHETRSQEPRPLVIGHRGASGYRPEHTREAYLLAIEQGADYIEPDLVATKDGVLIARHENEISETTDVAARFPDRRSTKTIDGQSVTGWFTEDFTLAEIKTLRARERLPFRDKSHDGRYPVLTFAEVLELARDEGRKRGRPVGVYPETKHPTYFADLGLPLEEALVAELKRFDLDAETAPVFIQSFEVANLKKLRSLTAVRLIQLLGGLDETPFDQVRQDARGLTYGAMMRDAGLREIATYAFGIGPAKDLLREGRGAASNLVTRAHAHGLKVHAWTFRSDLPFLSRTPFATPEAEYQHFFAMGLDGVFSDFPDAAVAARARFAPSNGSPKP